MAYWTNRTNYLGFGATSVGLNDIVSEADVRLGRTWPRVSRAYMAWPATAAFDGALMTAMDRPWRDIVFSAPEVVPSGMMPPDIVSP